MNNFEHFETREFNTGLLNEMYNVPSKELSTNRITEILSVVTGMKLDNIMVSTIFANAGLKLRERTRVAPKNVEVKPKRVTKAETVSNLLSQLGIVNTITDDVVEDDTTEQEQQWVDETIESNQLVRNTESIYGGGGVEYNHVSA